MKFFLLIALKDLGTADQSKRWGNTTFIIVEELHCQADIVWERAQVLHQNVDLADEEDARLLGVCTADGRIALFVLTANREHSAFIQTEGLLF